MSLTSPRSFRPGFTVLEALIVVALFGLLATLGAVSLNSARARLRDAQRLSDISLVRHGLYQYFLDKASYPPQTGVFLAKPAGQADALTAAGFVAKTNAAPPIYMPNVPAGPGANEYYRYHGSSSGYSLRFQTENDTDLGKPNVYFAHTNIIDRADDEK